MPDQPTQPPDPHDPNATAAPHDTPADAYRPTLAAAAEEAAVLEPGRIIAGRYRIVTRLGRGGMGEVYRADDLQLAIPVAIKFLPAVRSADPAWLAAFRAETRVARQVAHPNVCRVWDIAEVDGQTFITMEFIDGEDLASLLRRVGHLPAEKATQIARQLALGLAAIHEQGIVHRDLKPSNIMIDSRGRPRIADFGIAVAPSSAAGPAAPAAGTPLYMAPEQFAGRPATPQSDLYALGLVLFELFTGRHALDLPPQLTAQTLSQLHATSPIPRSPSLFAPGIPHAVEDAILRCLQPDPGLRPASPMALLAALPGGDPLAEALAAGLTPTPSVVAASGGAGAISRLLANVLAVVALLGLVAKIAHDGVLDRRAPAAALSSVKPPAILEDRARSLVARLRPKAIATDAHYAYTFRAPPQSPTVFVYRQSPTGLLSLPFGVVNKTSPFLSSGDVTVELSAVDGRLLSFRSVSQSLGSAPTLAADVQALTAAAFEAAGIDPESVAPMESRLLPLYVASDVRVAYVPRRANALPENAAWLEMAFSAGQLASFQLIQQSEIELARQLPDAGEQFLGNQSTVAGNLMAAGLLLLVFGAISLGVYNVVTAKADLVGSLRISVAVCFAWFITFAGTAHFPAPWLQTVLLLSVLAALSLGLSAATACFLYAALEPIVRRNAPNMLVSWTRLLSGRWRDPLVARDVLIGLAVAAAFTLAVAVLAMTVIPVSANPARFTAPVGVRDGLGSVAANALVGILFGLLGAFVFGLVLHFTRVRVVAYLLAWLIMVLAWFRPPFTADVQWYVVITAAGALVSILLIDRLGLLAFVVMYAATCAIAAVRFDTDLSAWHAAASLPAMAVVVAAVAFAWRHAQPSVPPGIIPSR